MSKGLHFVVSTFLGFAVRCTRVYWQFIITAKRPALAGREAEVKATLSDPDESRQSRQDPQVRLFHRENIPCRLCTAVRRGDGAACPITAYPAGAITTGERIWTRSR